MTSYRAIPLEDRDAWESALRGVPHAHAHTWPNCHAIALSSGWDTYLWSARLGDERFVCAVAERRFRGQLDVVTPYGFTGFVGSAPCEELHDLWRRFAVERGYVCAYLVLNPVLSDRSYFAETATRHRTVYVLDLRLTEEQLFARLSLNRKREVRRTRESRKTIVHDQESLRDFFVSTYPDFMARRDAAAVYSLSPESLRSLCDAQGTFLVGAQRSGELRAAALFACTPHLGDYVFGISEKGERGYSAALIWKGALELRQRGIPFFNLGGGVVEGDGVEQFKQRFGGARNPLMSVRDVYRPDIYRELCALAGVDSERDTDYFPSYRVPSQVPQARA